MSNGNNLPDVGDVIVSAKFAYGYYDSEERKIVFVDGETVKRPMGYVLSENERVAIAARTGEEPPKKRTVELGAYDKSRGVAKFVVEDARLTGGSTGRDSHSDGWQITARRLDGKDKYDPCGEPICFYMSRGFTCMVDIADVRIVGKMQRKVTFI